MGTVDITPPNKYYPQDSFVVNITGNGTCEPEKKIVVILSHRAITRPENRRILYNHSEITILEGNYRQSVRCIRLIQSFVLVYVNDLNSTI